MMLHTQLSVVILFFCLSVACMASSVVARVHAMPQTVVNHILGFVSNELARAFSSSVVARIHAMPQAVVDHILGFASNELARAFMMVQELQTFVIMDPWVFDEGSAATFEWLRMHAQGQSFPHIM